MLKICIMKRICLIMAALLVGLSSMSAKKTKETKSDLVGIWQQVRNIEHGDGKVNIVFNPVLKIIEKDGTFSTMFVNSPQSAGTITQKGTFAVQNDSLYSETVKAHFMPDNHASRRVLEKCMMLPEGVRREAMYAKGRYIDIETYAITEKDYKKITNR